MSENENGCWERVGRNLLSEQLELANMTLHEAITSTVTRVNAGEEPTHQNIEEMRQALENASHIIEVAAEASPNATPLPDASEFLDEDGRTEYVQELERRQELTNKSG